MLTLTPAQLLLLFRSMAPLNMPAQPSLTVGGGLAAVTRATSVMVLLWPCANDHDGLAYSHHVPSALGPPQFSPTMARLLGRMSRM
jgi:hypothetical protein